MAKNETQSENTNADERTTAPDELRQGRKRRVARARFQSRFWKLGRLAAYCGFVGLAGSGLAVGSAYGDAKEGALELGTELGKLGEIGDGKPLILNGQPIHFASTVQNATVTEVLDQAEDYCNNNPVGLRAVLENLPDLAKKDIPEAILERKSEVMREDADGRGMVTCFVDQDGSHSDQSLFDRMSEFAKTGDMSAVGDLRYVFAERNPGGTSHIIAVWTDGPFNLKAFAPDGDKDTPGFDPHQAARPIESTRLLTVAAEDMPYGVWIYRSDFDGEQIFQTMDADMKHNGWQLLAGDAPDKHRRIYQRGERDMIVTGVKHKDHLIISMVEMAPR